MIESLWIWRSIILGLSLKKLAKSKIKKCSKYSRRWIRYILKVSKSPKNFSPLLRINLWPSRRTSLKLENLLLSESQSLLKWILSTLLRKWETPNLELWDLKLAILEIKVGQSPNRNLPLNLTQEGPLTRSQSPKQLDIDRGQTLKLKGNKPEALFNTASGPRKSGKLLKESWRKTNHSIKNFFKILWCLRNSRKSINLLSRCQWRPLLEKWRPCFTIGSMRRSRISVKELWRNTLMASSL